MLHRPKRGDVLRAAQDAAVMVGAVGAREPLFGNVAYPVTMSATTPATYTSASSIL